MCYSNSVVKCKISHRFEDIFKCDAKELLKIQSGECKDWVTSDGSNHFICYRCDVHFCNHCAAKHLGYSSVGALEEKLSVPKDGRKEGASASDANEKKAIKLGKTKVGKTRDLPRVVV